MTQGADWSDRCRMVGGRQPHPGAEEHCRIARSLQSIGLGKSSLRRCRRPSGIERGFEDYRAMLDAVPMDGVVISSPHKFHHEHASAALEKGCHVLVEKPMATTARDARDLVAKAKRAEREIVIPYGWNFKPWTDEARRLATKVGRVEHVVLQMANALDDLFAGKPMIETEGAMFRPPASTWADPKAAGGFGWGQLVHPLGLLFRVADLVPTGSLRSDRTVPRGRRLLRCSCCALRRRCDRLAFRCRDASKGSAGADRPAHLRIGGHAPPRYRTRAAGASPA